MLGEHVNEIPESVSGNKNKTVPWDCPMLYTLSV